MPSTTLSVNIFNSTVTNSLLARRLAEAKNFRERLSGYKVNLTLTFVMEDAVAGGSSGTGIGPEDAPRQPTGA